MAPFAHLMLHEGKMNQKKVKLFLIKYYRKTTRLIRRTAEKGWTGRPVAANQTIQ
ncbi:MAG: hypothetical protein WD599_01215 [Balneolaceae bacterium]